MSASRQIPYPNSHWGWHRYYVNRFNKHENPISAWLAMAYLLLHLRDEEGSDALPNQGQRDTLQVQGDPLPQAN